MKARGNAGGGVPSERRTGGSKGPRTNSTGQERWNTRGGRRALRNQGADPADAGSNLVEVHALTKVYGEGEGEVLALAGVDLRIERGEFIAIMGPSGSGKSTLMHLLGCLDRPTSGRYLLNGREVSTLSRDDLARVRSRQIGFVFQDFNLLPRTSALENVELPMLYTGTPHESRSGRARALLNTVGLGDRETHRPNELSGGQKQRVAIARSLAIDAPFLLADEPTGNLDSRSSREIMELFQSLNRSRGITVVVVTHDPEVAHWAHRTVTLADGRVVAESRREQA